MDSTRNMHVQDTTSFTNSRFRSLHYCYITLNFDTLFMQSAFSSPQIATAEQPKWIKSFPSLVKNGVVQTTT